MQASLFLEQLPQLSQLRLSSVTAQHKSARHLALSSFHLWNNHWSLEWCTGRQTGFNVAEICIRACFVLEHVIKLPFCIFFSHNLYNCIAFSFSYSCSLYMCLYLCQLDLLLFLAQSQEYLARNRQNIPKCKILQLRNVLT